MSTFGNPSYGITATLKGVSYGDAIERTEKALKDEGFGVLTRIDIKDTLRRGVQQGTLARLFERDVRALEYFG